MLGSDTSAPPTADASIPFPNDHSMKATDDRLLRHAASRRVVGTLVTALVALSACTGSRATADRVAMPPVDVAATGEATPCQLASTQRQRVKGLLAEGRLHRTLAVIARANELCANTREETWAAEVTTLAEIGRYRDADSLAREIVSATRASEDGKRAATEALQLVGERDQSFTKLDAPRARQLLQRARAAARIGQHRAAKKLYLRAWHTSHPNGAALYGAGRATKALGDAAGAQRLFDRAVVDLEHETGEPLQLGTSNGFRDARALLWSPDGSFVAVADETDVVLLDGETFRETGRLAVEAGHVAALAFSPDSHTVVAESTTGITYLWDPRTGRLVHTLEGHVDAVSTVAFGSDAQTMATGSADQTIRIWNPVTGHLIRTINQHPGPVHDIAFCLDGKALASSSGKELHLWDPNTGELVRSLPGGGEHSWSVSPDGKSLAHTDWDLSVHLRSVETGEERHSLVGHRSIVYDVAFSPDSKLLASGSSNEYAHDDAIRLWDRETGDLVRTFAGHRDPVRALAFSHDGRHLASASATTLRFWDTTSGRLIRTLERHAPRVSGVAFSPDGKLLAAAEGGNSIRLWDVASGRHRHLLDGAASAIAFSPDGAEIASSPGNDQDKIQLWDVATGTLLRAFCSGHDSIAFSPDGSKIVSPAVGCVYECSAGLGKFENLYESEGAVSVALSPDGKTLAIGHLDDSTVGIWNVASRQLVRRLEGHTESVPALAFDPSGKALASGSTSGIVRLWNIASGSQQRALEGETAVTSLAFTHDGDRLVAAHIDGAIGVWNSATGEPVRSFQDPQGAVYDVAIRQDDELLVTAGHDGVGIFSAETGQQLLEMRRLQGSATTYAFTPNGYVEILGADAREVRQRLACRIGPRYFPFELCAERFEAKSLIHKAVAGDTSFRNP